MSGSKDGRLDDLLATIVVDKGRFLGSKAHQRPHAGIKDLAEIAEASPTAVSQHLAKLRLARLVKSRKSGTYVYYTTEDVHVHRLLEQALFHAHHATGRSAHHEQEKTGRGDGRASKRPGGRTARVSKQSG
ncbi:MAG: ArsR family transcriptional regulator [Actinobacteria bacterium]|nr:ArsR family transcriptional regulator [Actinomycetota bacterium]